MIKIWLVVQRIFILNRRQCSCARTFVRKSAQFKANATSLMMMPLPSLRPRSEQNQWYWMVMCMDLGVRRGGSVVASCLAARLSLKTVLMVEFRSPYSGIQPNTFDVAANCYRLILGDKILLSPSLISMKWVVPLMRPMQPISKYDDLSLDVLQKQQLPGRVAFSYLWQPAPPKLSSMPL